MATQPFAGLASKIKAQYAAALKAGSLLFTESEVVELDDEQTGIPFEVRFAPALAKKPTHQAKGDQQDERRDAPSDPFAPPYQQDLYVAEDIVKEDEHDAGEGFVVLLNKFCVTPRHFLLVTKQFVKQTMPLSPVEIYTAWSILKQLSSREKHLAFFNCGANSGASQPHKHLQFIPLSNGVAPFDSFIDAYKPKNEKSCFQLPLPYANFTALLDVPSNSSAAPAYLGHRFLELLDLMVDHRRRLAEDEPLLANGPVRLSELSYNVVMTASYIHLVPRRREKFTTLTGRAISINSLGFAGMILVKEQEALDEVKEVGVLKVLEDVALKPVELGDTHAADAIVAGGGLA
ncbi:ATP adenylyltransferase [Rhodotorula toruloides]|uniref:ATP adenylyltransferase n=1 Tax=Rhodotorula toruloides TaxID=5286 RepID=A0A511K7M5_RHOTO|nr:ATP adenylyltransferase [Rhodotorula toruloides]